jgi:hypothetical protein
VRIGVYGMHGQIEARAGERADRAARRWMRAPRGALLYAEEEGLCHWLSCSPSMALLWLDTWAVERRDNFPSDCTPHANGRWCIVGGGGCSACMVGA